MILDFLFPKYCLECKKGAKYICNECYSKVSSYGAKGSNYSIFKYEGVIKKALISLKYKFATDICDEIVDICALKLPSFYLPHSTILVPIPLHRLRENWRGFNQTEVIGEKLAKKLNIKYIPDLLIKNKNTIPQVGLKVSARHQNLSGVFSVNLKYSSQFTVDRSLLLFDDVYTTGSTINEAKRVLLEAGFKNIKSLTIAR